MKLRRFGLALAALAAGGAAVTAAQRPGNPRQPVVVDSILPTGELLSRFRKGLAVVTTLGGTARTHDGLMRSLETALQREDAASVASLAISRSEYAYLYYPSSRYAREPYDLPPEIAWMLHTSESEKGLRRLVRRLGGDDFRLDSYQCGSETTEGANRILHGCTVTYRSRGMYATQRLFASVVERDGRFKFLSFANDF